MAASTTQQHSSSRFSTLKIFRLAGSKPPPPPPKDAVYLYPSAKNPSLVSLSNQSVHPSSSPKQTSPSGPISIRSPSPTPSRVLQSSSPQRLHPPPPVYQQHQSPPTSTSSSATLSPDLSSGSGKKGFFRKMSGLRKRSASKSPRMTSPEDATDDESISLPWNFQHHIHIDDAFQGIPPAWSSTLSELGYSDAEIALILKGRRDRAPDPSSLHDCSPTVTPSRSQSPTSTYAINPPTRSTSLRRQRSDASISRSERSVRVTPAAPPPPLPLLPAPQPLQVPSPSMAAPAPPPPTPAPGSSGTSNGPTDSDAPSTPSEVQYIYVNHQRQTPNGLMAIPPPAPVPIIQPAPVRQPSLSRTNSVATTRNPPSRGGSVSSDRDRLTRVQPPPRRTFRVVNEASPPPVYSDNSVPYGSPPPITLGDALRPRPQEKAEYSPVSPTPQSRIKTPPPVSPPRRDKGSPHGATTSRVGSQEKRQEQGEQDRASSSDRSSSEHPRPPRPAVLSIPPRISLRKDMLEDLSSWSASLFSSIPSALQDSPGSSTSTAATSAFSTRSSGSESSKHKSKPSVTLPTIVLQPEVREEDEDGDEEGEEDEVIEHGYSQSASPLYHELMGMMQGRAATAHGVGSPGPGSPASATSFQLDAASTSSRDTTSRDSQLTIRFNPRDSCRDSSASTSTLTHATIVRGASIVRRVRADVVTTPPASSTLKGKERGRAPPPPMEIVQVVREDDDDEGDSSSDYADSDEDDSPGSPAGTLAFTSAPNSQEDAATSRKSLRQVHGHGSPLASPSPSPLRASFPEPISEELAQDAQKDDTDPPSSAEPTKEEKVENDGIVRPKFTFTGAGAPRYPTWLAAVVLPLAEFIDDSADPRALFSDLQEIAQGESGLVYSARAVPAVLPQFQPPPPHSPASGSISSRSTTPERGYEEDEDGGAQSQQKHGLVAIKRVPLLRGGTEKLTDLRGELELARALRHANVLRMERLYVDVAEECLWIGMELMDRSLADALAVVGEDVGPDLAAAEEGDPHSVGSGLVEIPETMVARFVWDILLALSYLRKNHIAHRDVRSDNLLLSRSGVLKLSDFSTAVRSPPGTPKCSDPVGVIYWQAPEMRTGLYDPLKVDVWSLGATTWELVHGDPPFADVQDVRLVSGTQLPPVRQADAFSRPFHDFLHSCSQPAASRPDPDELLNAHLIRTACPRSEIVQLLGQCKAIDEQQLLRQSSDSD